MTAPGVTGEMIGPSKENKREKAHGHRQQCGDCQVEAGGWRWKRVWGINGNGKNTIKKFPYVYIIGYSIHKWTGFFY